MKEIKPPVPIWTSGFLLELLLFRLVLILGIKK
jgi:hypothetical protein